ncbi:MAG: ACP phosphodiesterase [Pseudomonadota bacterium]
MNFLAHCALADDHARHWDYDLASRSGLLAGAIFGDFIKGRVPGAWPLALQRGARLHRRIDALSNRDPDIRTTCERFPTHLRRVAPILVDILADYHLTRHWATYADEALTTFSQRVYRSLQDQASYMPSRAQRFVAYMTDADLLAHYDEWLHLDRAVDSVVRRLPARLDLEPEELHAALRAIAPASTADFHGYYASLQQATTGLAPEELNPRD